MNSSDTATIDRGDMDRRRGMRRFSGRPLLVAGIVVGAVLLVGALVLGGIALFSGPEQVRVSDVGTSIDGVSPNGTAGVQQIAPDGSLLAPGAGGVGVPSGQPGGQPALPAPGQPIAPGGVAPGGAPVPQGGAPAGQAPAGQAPAGQAPAGQAPAGQAPPGQAPPGN